MNEEWIECAGDAWLRKSAIIKVRKSPDYRGEKNGYLHTWMAYVGDANCEFITDADAMRIVGKNQPAFVVISPEHALAPQPRVFTALEICAIALMLMALGAAGATLAHVIVGSFKR